LARRFEQSLQRFLFYFLPFVETLKQEKEKRKEISEKRNNKENTKSIEYIRHDMARCFK
jgi:hypothetical protein